MLCFAKQSLRGPTGLLRNAKQVGQSHGSCAKPSRG